MKSLLPRMTLEEAATAMTERTEEHWTARDILGAGARQELTVHAKIPTGMKMVRCEPIEAGQNELEMVAGVLFPLDSNTVTRLLVGPDVEVKELHGPKRLAFLDDYGTGPKLDDYGTGPEWEIAEGETAPRVTASDCWILDSSLERLISKHSAPVDSDDEQTNPADDADHDETLAALFDLVPVEALETMFPAGGKWSGWAGKAKEKGLLTAREGRGMFNPYKAGMWFVQRGAPGWDIDRLYKRLAKNLPARSRDSAHLLTGDFE